MPDMYRKWPDKMVFTAQSRIQEQPWRFFQKVREYTGRVVAQVHFKEHIYWNQFESIFTSFFFRIYFQKSSQLLIVGSSSCRSIQSTTTRTRKLTMPHLILLAHTPIASRIAEFFPRFYFWHLFLDFYSLLSSLFLIVLSRFIHNNENFLFLV